MSRDIVSETYACPVFWAAPKTCIFETMTAKQMNTNYSTTHNSTNQCTDLITYLLIIMVMFLTGTQELVPSLLMSILLLEVFGSSLYVLFEPPSPAYCKKRRHHAHPNRKRVRKWRRRALPYRLVRCCRRCLRHRPPRLGGSFFPSPHCNRLRCWVTRRRACARAFFSLCKLEKFISGRKDQYSP